MLDPHTERYDLVLDTVGNLGASAADLLRGVADGSIEPIIDSTMPLEDVVSAHRRVDSRHKVGSVLQNKLAVSIGVPPRRINEIVHGKRSITADTALRLSRYFGTSAEFWLNLQAHYDLDLAADRAAEQIAAITPLTVA